MVELLCMYTEIVFDNDVIAATPDRCMKSWEVITSDIHVAALSKDDDLGPGKFISPWSRNT